MTIFMFLLLALQVAMFGITAYGVYLSCLKHWGLGVVSILVPGFALVIGGAKLIFKKELLAQ